MQEGIEAREYTRGQLVRAFTGVGLAPITAAITFFVKYMSVPFACEAGNTLVLHAISVLALAISAYGFLSAYWTWELGGRGWPGEEPDPATRNRFLGILGMLFSSLMLLLILAQWVPIFFLNPCIHG